MPEFDSLGWSREKLDGSLARSIRSSIRLRRRERGRGGHRYRFNTLKNLWAVDVIHAVVNHTDDPEWQYYYNHPSEGWLLISWHLTRREAQAAAELPLPPELVPTVASRATVEGWHVLAGWKKDKFTMDVPCTSEEIAGEIEETFQVIGCHTSKSLVTA